MSPAKPQKPNVVAWVLTLAIGVVVVWLLASMFTGRNEAVRQLVAPGAKDEAAETPQADIAGEEVNEKGNEAAPPGLEY